MQAFLLKFLVIKAIIIYYHNETDNKIETESSNEININL